MIEKLFDLYDELNKKEKKIVSVLEILGGEENSGFLESELGSLEQLIVISLGGNIGHFKYINSTFLFNEYQGGNETRENVIIQIKEVIENDWTGEIPMEITLGE